MYIFSQWKIPRYSLLSRPSSSEDESTTGFLQDGDAEHEWLKEEHLQPTPTSFYRRHSTAIMVHTALALCNIMLLGTFLWPKSNYVPNAIPTPFQEAISYKLDVLGDDVRLTDNGTVVPHYDRERGPPSPELEAAWDELLQYSNIRLSRDELGADFRDNPALVELSDGSGIYSSAAVFHSIHCIKRVRYMLYPEHYHANKTTEEMDELKKHAGASVVFDTGIKLIEDTEHCLNYLLHSAKCNADLTVFPMQWGAGQRIPFGIDQGRRQCKDWDRIQDWAKQRSFDIYKPGLIMHPTLGWAYADGVEMVTGVANDTLLADTLEKEE